MESIRPQKIVIDSSQRFYANLKRGLNISGGSGPTHSPMATPLFEVKATCIDLTYLNCILLNSLTSKNLKIGTKINVLGCVVEICTGRILTAYPINLKARPANYGPPAQIEIRAQPAFGLLLAQARPDKISFQRNFLKPFNTMMNFI